jgi:hypothetical protein
MMGTVEDRGKWRLTHLSLSQCRFKKFIIAESESENKANLSQAKLGNIIWVSYNQCSKKVYFT